LYQIDMETDSVVDSIKHEDPGMWPAAMDVSADGRFLALSYTDALGTRTATRIFDAQTLTFIRELSGALAPFFDTERNLMLGLHSGLAGIFLSFRQLPTFEEVRVDSLGNFGPQLIDVRHHLLYGRAYAHGWTHEYPHGLYTYDYLNGKLQFVQPIHPNGDTLWFSSGCLNRDGSILYFRAEYASAPIWGTTSLVAYDLTKRQMLWIYPNMSQVGGTALSPDEKEVWMTDQGPPGFINNSGTIYVLDAATGTYLQGMSMYGYSWNPLVGLPGGGIIFSPTGEKAYVNAGSANDRWLGSVAVVDAKQKKILKFLTPDLERWPRVLRIGPKT
jgi:hypothetical protein